MEEAEAGTEVAGGTLRIVGAQVEDGGIYMCLDENSGGQNQVGVIVEVLPRSKPTLSLFSNETATATVGGSAMFACRASGEPKPTVTLTRAGGESFVSETTEVKQGGVLMFTWVNGEEQGSYTCTASNSIGTVSASATLLIAGPPRVIIQPSRPVYAVIGQKISLECVAQEVPHHQWLTNAIVQWRRREGSLSPNHSIQGGTLYIPCTERVCRGVHLSCYRISQKLRNFRLHYCHR
ncbi:contactin-4-like isoform X2 [Crassostrea virginica]